MSITSNYIVTAGNTLMLKVETKNNNCPDAAFEYKFKTDEAAVGADTAFTNSYCDGFASEYKNYIAVVFNESIPIPTITSLSPSGATASYNNPQPTNITCDVTSGGSLTNVSLYITNSTNQSYTFNQTVNVSGTSDTATFELTLPETGSWTYGCMVDDNTGLGPITTNESFQYTRTLCTVEFESTGYSQGESVSVRTSCSDSAQASQSYSLIFYNTSGGTVLQTDVGTTSATPSTNSYETYNLPSNYVSTYGSELYVEINGTNLGGSANVSIGEFGVNDLVITNASIGGKWLGLTSSVQATVKDSSGNLISGGQCVISVWSNDETTMLERIEAILIGGEVKGNWISKYDSFSEGTDYAVKIRCMCGSDGSYNECIAENGY